MTGSESTHIATLLLTMGIVSLGCTPESAPPGVTVRDSAGVTLVESLASQWPSGEAWAVAPTPALTIGSLDGPHEQQLYRVFGAHRLPDGRIVVANSGSYELRFYDRDGQFLAASGGRGGGPGEFVSMGQNWLIGD